MDCCDENKDVDKNIEKLRFRSCMDWIRSAYTQELPTFAGEYAIREQGGDLAITFMLLRQVSEREKPRARCVLS